MTSTWTLETARSSDALIAAAWGLYWDVKTPALEAEKAVAKAEKMIRYYGGEEARRAAIYVSIRNKAIARRDLLEAEAAPLRDAAVALDADLYEGWTRFFLVKHIHRSMSCSSFRPTTRIGWLPKVSGLTEAEAVAEYDATLCTICFPSAPVQR